MQLPELYSEQQRIKSEARRFNVLDIGRRAGKTYLGIHLALETALAGYPVGWFSPKYKYVSEIWRDLLRPLKDVATKVNASDHRIDLPNGGVIEVWSLEKNEDPGRSRKYKRAIIDEAAVASNLKIAWEEAIRPTLTDLEGDAWFLSTPKGLNFFHDLFIRGQDDVGYPQWVSWQMPSSVNPYLPVNEIELARGDLPEMVFKQEYLAEFISAAGAVFRNLDACLNAAKTSSADHKGHYIVAGVDWAMKNDFTAISIFCKTCKCEVALDRFNQIDWALQRGRLTRLYQEWRISLIVAESNSIGGPNLEALQLSGLPVRGFETTASSKPPLIQSLALAFERTEAQWLPDPVAKGELLAYEATINSFTGRVKYSAVDDKHDDTVIARALAWHAINVGQFEQGKWRR